MRVSGIDSESKHLHLSRQICRRIAATLFAFAAVLSSFAVSADGVWDETRYEYDPGTGDLLKKIYPDGHEIIYTYYETSLPKRITYASGKWMERFYNERLQAVSNVYSSANTPSVHASPNAFGTICRTEDSWGLVYDYGIRPYGQLLTNEVVSSPWMNWQLAHAHEQFDREFGWSLSVDNVSKGCTYWIYDSEGRISYLVCTNSFGRSIEVVYTNSGSYACGYDIRTPSGAVFSHRLTRSAHRRALVDRLTVGFSGNTILDRSFEYNDLGKLTRWSDSGSTNEAVYCYGDRGEIVQCDVLGVRYAYGFDSAGNCRGAATGFVTNFFSVNQLNQCTASDSSDAGGTESYEYDLDGNLTRVCDMDRFGWDGENRLFSVVLQDGTVTNRYDYQNRLVRQDLPGCVRHCVFDRWNLVYERYQHDMGLTEEVEYFWGPDKSGSLSGACGVGGLVAVSMDGSFYFPYYGINGDILGYVNEDGSVVASYAYGPFGELASLSGDIADLFQFRYMTKRYDRFIGLYDFGDRWYSITLRKWISRDPLGEDGGLNLYAFCDNDPVNKFDPNGCIPLDTVWDIGNIVYDICVGDEVALAADTAALMVPYVPAGASKLVKAARLSNVKKICPGAKHLEVTYRYNKYGDKHFKLKSRPQPVTANWKRESWVERTLSEPAQFRPGFTHADGERLANAALREAKAKGLIRPQQLDGYIYNAGINIGAHNGKPTSFVKVKVTPQGEVHIHPITP